MAMNPFTFTLICLASTAIALPNDQREVVRTLCENLTGWCDTTAYDASSSSQDYCSVLSPFVVCVEDDLTELVLQGLNNGAKVGGSIPTQIGRLTGLRRLISRNQDISGALPSELGNTQLYDLNLQENSLTGEIPSELGRLALVGLDLGENNFQGTIPSEIMGSSLQTLALRENDLSGPIPNEITNAINLRFLLLSRNQLTGSIPTHLGALKTLFELQLYDNQLEGEIPTEIGELSEVKVITLHNNRLTGTIPTELGNLVFGTGSYMFLGDNDLRGTIPSELGRLDKLVHLAIFNCPKLTGTLPTELANMNNMVSLWITETSVFGEIPTELAGLSKLFSLRLSNNYLAGPIPEFTSFTSNPVFVRQEFYIDGNYFSGFLPTYFGQQVSFNCSTTHLAPSQVCPNQRPLCTGVLEQRARDLQLGACLSSTTGFIQGSVSFLPASDEACFSEYQLYFGSSTDPTGSVLARVPKQPRQDNGRLTLSLLGGTNRGVNTHFHILSYSGLPTGGVQAALVDTVPISLASVPLCVVSQTPSPSPRPVLSPGVSQSPSVGASPLPTSNTTPPSESGSSSSNTTAIAIAVIVVSIAAMIVAVAIYRYRNQKAKSRTVVRPPKPSSGERSTVESTRGAFIL